jgi:DNA repair protein RecN (Recombination protein N)
MSATLASLRIKNFALVEDLTWAPGAGFNAVSGETGAGKSVLIGALKLLLGERGDRSLIRAGAEQCVVEAVFSITEDQVAAELDGLLDSAGVEACEGGELLLKRTMSAQAGRQFVNGSPCTIGLLRELGERLVDLHGPHDHQSLFSREAQTRLLDEFSGCEELVRSYREARRRWLALREEAEALREDEQAGAREVDLLRHQIAEIEAAGFEPGDEEELPARHRVASQARRILEVGAGCLALLEGETAGLESVSGELGRQLRELARMDEAVTDLGEAHAAWHEGLLDLGRRLQSYLDRVEADPETLAELESRLDTLVVLQRKYGPTVVEIHAFAERAAERLRELEGREARGANLPGEIAAAEKEMRQWGEKLGEGRRKGGKKLGKAVAGHLRELNFARAEFSIGLEELSEPGPHGLELAEFSFAPNPGEPAHPLRAIASSGEISRVMLALKCALAAQDRVALLVFDEIDANVGGETATRVGEKMALLGRDHQVLCITHLPQVAAAAGHHFLVEKSLKGGRTVSFLTELAGEDREQEVARMLGGADRSAVEHARTLLGRTRAA